MSQTNEPVVLDAEEVSYARRPRLFWFNFDLQVQPHENVTLKGPFRFLRGWGVLPEEPPWEHTGFTLTGQAALCINDAKDAALEALGGGAVVGGRRRARCDQGAAHHRHRPAGARPAAELVACNL